MDFWEARWFYPSNQSRARQVTPLNMTVPCNHITWQLTHVYVACWGIFLIMLGNFLNNLRVIRSTIARDVVIRGNLNFSSTFYVQLSNISRGATPPNAAPLVCCFAATDFRKSRQCGSLNLEPNKCPESYPNPHSIPNLKPTNSENFLPFSRALVTWPFKNFSPITPEVWIFTLRLAVWFRISVENTLMPIVKHPNIFKHPKCSKIPWRVI